MQFPPLLFKKNKNKVIPGQFFRALSKDGGSYVHDQLRVYADKTIAGNYILSNLPIERLYKHVSKFLPKIEKKYLVGMKNWTDENINAIPFEDFKFLVRNKLVTQNYKGEVRIEFCDDPIIEEYYLVNMDMNISDEDFIISLEDIFCDLNDRPTSARIFLNTLCEFLQVPKELKEFYRKKLLEAYLDIPLYQRKYAYPLSIGLEGKTPIEDIFYKRESRFDYYEDFVKAYGDDYFESRYKTRDY